MNFRVVEGERPILNENDYISFENDYLNSKIPNYKLRRDYQLSNKNFQEITHQIKQKHGLNQRPRNCKHYYPLRDKWVVSFKKDGRNIYLGFYHTEEEAKSVVKKCEELDWNVELCKQYVEQLQ